MTIDKTAIRNASTVIVLRDRHRDPHVLMGQRGSSAAFMPDKFVFPGGAVDDADRAVPLVTPLPDLCAGRLCDDAPADLAHALAAAAIRETVEEAGANIELGPLFTMLNVAHVHQVHLFYLARLLDLDYAAGIESLEVELFSEREIPWADLAFPTIRTTLELFFEDRKNMREGGRHGFHEHDIVKPMRAAGSPPPVSHHDLS